MSTTICAATCRDGTPCHGRARPGDDMCFVHSETTRERRAAGQAAGGRGRSMIARTARYLPPALTPLLGSLVEAMEQVHTGAITPAQGTAMASLASACVRVYEMAVVEQRLESLVRGRVIDARAVERSMDDDTETSGDTPLD